MYDQKLVAAQIAAIRNRKNLTEEAFAETIGVSGSYINQVKKGKKNLSDKKVELMCKVHELDPRDLKKDISAKEIEIHESISDMMRIRKLDLSEMAKLTDINELRLSLITLGKEKPTNEEIKKISGALKTTPETLSSGVILLHLENIRKSLEVLQVPENEMNICLDYIEKVIKTTP